MQVKLARRPRSVWLTMVALVAVPGTVSCQQDPVDGPTTSSISRSVATPEAVRYVDREAGVRFDHPAGLAVSAEHFAGASDPGEIRHIFTLTAARLERFRVELWRNPTRTPLDLWFKRHLLFMVDGTVTITHTTVGPHRRVMAFVWPKNARSTGQRILLFSLDDLMVRVTCQRGHRRADRAVQDDLVRSFARVDGGQP